MQGRRASADLLFAVILILVIVLFSGVFLFAIQNQKYLSEEESINDFDVDYVLLKVLVKQNEYIQKQLSVMATSGHETRINANILGLEDLIKLDSSSFALKPGQTKILNLNFSSFDSRNGIEQQPGVYVGRLVLSSNNIQRELPIIFEVETKNVLFDINLNPVVSEKDAKQGKSAQVEIKLFNLQSVESQDVELEYFVKDTNGNAVFQENEKVNIKTQASFFKTIPIPENLKDGNYIFAAQIRYGNSVGTASYLFDVSAPEAQFDFVGFCRNNYLCAGISIITVLLIVVLMLVMIYSVISYFRSGIWQREQSIVIATQEKKPLFETLAERYRKISEERQKRREAKQAGQESQKMQDVPGKGIIPEETLRAHEHHARNLMDFLHALGFYKTHEERAEIELNKQHRLEEKERVRLEAERQKALAEREIEEEKQKKLLIQKQIMQQREKTFLNLLHGIGLYKTPQEKRRIKLEKEKEIEENIKLARELRKLKEMESKAGEESLVRKASLTASKNLRQIFSIADGAKIAFAKKDYDEVHESYIKARDLYVHLPDLEKKPAYHKLMDIYNLNNHIKREKEGLQRKEESKKRAEERKRRILGLLHKLGLYTAKEEKKRIALQKEKELQEKLRKDAELKKQQEKKANEEEEQRIIEEKKARLEALKLQKEDEKRKKEEFRKQEQERRLEQLESKRLEVQKKKEILQQQIEAKKLERKQEKERKRQEIEEKRIEKARQRELKRLEVNAKLKEKIKGIIGKGNNEEEFFDDGQKIRILENEKMKKILGLMGDAEHCFDEGNMKKAKEIYSKAREEYITLDYSEKKEIYKPLNELYGKLLGKA